MPSALEKCRQKIILSMSGSHMLENQTMIQYFGDDVYRKFTKEQKTTTEKNQLIFEQIKAGGEESYNVFKQILDETRHFKLLSELEAAEMGIAELDSDLWPRIASKSLKICKSVIKSDLNARLTLDKFEELEFTDGITIRDISDQTTTTDKIAMIYDEVDKQGTHGYETFKTILDETLQTGVQESIEKAEKDATNDLVTTKDVVQDYIGYRLNTKPGLEYGVSHRHESNGKVKLFDTVRGLCSEFEERFNASFPGDSLDTVTSIESVFTELFEDGTNWGRIVAAIAFSAAVTEKYTRDGNDVEEIEQGMINCLDIHVGSWIRDQGGWVAIIDFSIVETAQFNNDNAQQVSVQADVTAVMSLTPQPFTALLLAVASGFYLGISIGGR